MNKDYINKTVIFESPYGSINAPISAFLDQEEIDKIIEDNNEVEEDIEMEILDLIYFSLEMIPKIV